MLEKYIFMIFKFLQISLNCNLSSMTYTIVNVIKSFATFAK